MAKIEIVENKYNTICDTYGCNNIGTHMIGKPGENLGFHHILCNECLQNIINIAPVEMIMNRPEFAALKDDAEEDIEITNETVKEILKETAEEKLENVGKALEGETDLHELKYQQLKEIATEKGITVPFGTTKDDLIAMIEEK